MGRRSQSEAAVAAGNEEGRRHQAVGTKEALLKQRRAETSVREAIVAVFVPARGGELKHDHKQPYDY
jgi:hypothetical protein